MSAKQRVRTVLGDIPADDLGVCDAHDHLFFRTPQLPRQELDDQQAATAELRAFRDLGGRSVVQWSPFGLGRQAGRLAAVSRSSGVNVIAATGLHQAVHYEAAQLKRVRDRMIDLFISEITQGIRIHEDPDEPPGPVRAGLIKAAGGFHSLDEHAHQVMIAAAQAHRATGAPIAVHHELGTAALDVVEFLCGDLDVPPVRVILGHLNRSPDLYIHRQLAESGAFLAFDGPSRASHATDWRLFDALTALTEAGHADQLLVGGDTTTAAARAATGGGPGIPYLLRRLLPRLVHELGDDVATKIFVHNPARAFAFAP